MDLEQLARGRRRRTIRPSVPCVRGKLYQENVTYRLIGAFSWTLDPN